MPKKAAATKKVAVKKKTAVKKKSVKKKTVKHSYAEERQTFSVPLKDIVGHSVQWLEVVPTLLQQGYTVFPEKGVDAEKTLWTMLIGDNADLRARAVGAIKRFEPQIYQVTQTILEFGQLDAVDLYYNKQGKLELADGERRLLAKAVLDYECAPNEPPGYIAATISDQGEDKARDRAIVHNWQRRNPKDMELARVLQQKLDENFSREAVAKMFGVTVQTVSNYVDLLELPLDIQKKVEAGRITKTSAREAVQAAKSQGRPVDEVCDEWFRKTTEEGGTKKKNSKKKTVKRMLKREEVENLLLEQDRDNPDHRHGRALLRTVLAIDEQEEFKIRDQRFGQIAGEIVDQLEAANAQKSS